MGRTHQPRIHSYTRADSSEHRSTAQIVAPTEWTIKCKWWWLSQLLLGDAVPSRKLQMQVKAGSGAMHTLPSPLNCASAGRVGFLEATSRAAQGSRSVPADASRYTHALVGIRVFSRLIYSLGQLPNTANNQSTHTQGQACAPFTCQGYGQPPYAHTYSPTACMPHLHATHAMLCG